MDGRQWGQRASCKTKLRQAPEGRPCRGGWTILPEAQDGDLSDSLNTMAAFCLDAINSLRDVPAAHSNLSQGP
jgi:hypothetical protein